MNVRIELSDGAEIKVCAERVMANNMKFCHSHAHYELYFLTEGERYLYAENRFYVMRLGDVFLMPPGIMHRTLDSGGGYSKFVAMLPKSVVPKCPAADFRIVRPSGKLLEELLAAAESVKCGDGDCFLTVMRLLSTVQKLPMYAEEALSSPTIGRVGEILNYLDNHFTEKISLVSLSERFYISEYYLCRLFKEYTGRTFNEYLAGLRVERAKLLLMEGIPVSRVWRDSGFGSESSFTRVFREKTGCSAREWKNKI